jgi:hypothetical protein
MAKTGSINKLRLLTVADWTSRQRVEQTPEFIAYAKGLELTLSTLKAINKASELDIMIRAEELLVEREIELNSTQDPAVLPSLKAAISDFAVIKNSVKTVKVPVDYQKAATTYHSKKKAHGVIADGCHEALNSHITRLGNRMSAVGISIPEKSILRQRQANMRAAKELYIELQRKALLGIEPPVITGSTYC